MKQKIFYKNLSFLMFRVTLSFAVKSSSIVGYVPLALITIMKDSHFLFLIIVTGMTIVVPSVLLNLILDTYFNIF